MRQTHSATNMTFTRPQRGVILKTPIECKCLSVPSQPSKREDPTLQRARIPPSHLDPPTWSTRGSLQPSKEGGCICSSSSLFSSLSSPLVLTSASPAQLVSNSIRSTNLLNPQTHSKPNISKFIYNFLIKITYHEKGWATGVYRNNRQFSSGQPVFKQVQLKICC